MKHLIDIITITKDDFQGVASTIESTEELRKQEDISQIIIDSSCEKIRKELGAFCKGKINIEYVWQEPLGISSAFNCGIERANAEWVWFLNGGDEVHPDIDPEKFIYIMKNSTADAVIFQIELMQSGGMMERPPLWGLWPPVFPWIPHPATLTRKKLYIKHGNFDTAYTIAMDYEFWFRCFSKNTIVDTLSIKLARYDETGLSRSHLPLLNREAVKAIKTHGLQMFKIWLLNGYNIYKAWRFFSRG